MNELEEKVWVKTKEEDTQIPILCRNRTISLEQSQIDKIKYLMLEKRMPMNNASDFVNMALKSFFATEFSKLNIEHYFDPGFEEAKRRNQEQHEEMVQRRNRARLIKVAKKKILEDEIKKLQDIEAKTGKPTTMEKVYPNVKVLILKRVTSTGQELNPGDKADIPSNIAERWEKHYICEIIKKGA